jgi:hypothetical protein
MEIVYYKSIFMLSWEAKRPRPLRENIDVIGLYLYLSLVKQAFESIGFTRAAVFSSLYQA